LPNHRRRRHDRRELAVEDTRDAGWVIGHARACLDAGAEIIMIESESITENVETWRTDVVPCIIDWLRSEKVMFEAAEPLVFIWYVKNYGAAINLFVDRSVRDGYRASIRCMPAGVDLQGIATPPERLLKITRHTDLGGENK